MPPPSDPRNLRAKWQRALEERRRAGAAAPPLDVTPRPGSAAKGARPGLGPSPGADAPVERPADDASPRAAAPGTDAPVSRPPAGAPLPGDDAPIEDAGSAVKPAAGRPGAKPRAEAEGDAPKKPASASSMWSTLGASVILVAGVGLALRTFIRPDDAPPSGEEEASPTASAQDSAAPVAPNAPPPRARCAAPASEAFVIGDAPSPKPAVTATDGDDDASDEPAPFAVELGRGVKFEGGFAVGSQRQAEGGTVSMIATVSGAGADGKLVRLARSRGDLDPPVVAAAGSSILAAMMEPNAGGRSIRIAKVDGDRVTWGPELSEGHDESFAVDLAAAGQRAPSVAMGPQAAPNPGAQSALVVWDDVPIGRERSVIMLATLDVATMRGGGARAVTPPSIDADVPRLAPRPGGFWLAYMVHGDAPTGPTAEGDDGPEDAGAEPAGRGGPKKRGASNPDDSDFQAAGEAIAHQWIELLPIDESGLSVGAPRAVTPKESRVIGYDLAAGEDGRAILVYREDDTPSGSNGGRVKVLTAELGGVGEPRVLAEDGVGAGVPQLLGGWVVIHSLTGPVQLGAMTPRGELAGDLAPEASLRTGEVLASSGGALLVATPAGRAMKLSVVSCAR